jgi:hypothetical protein
MGILTGGGHVLYVKALPIILDSEVQESAILGPQGHPDTLSVCMLYSIINPFLADSDQLLLSYR